MKQMKSHFICGPSPGLQRHVSDKSSPVGLTRWLLPLFYMLSALPDGHRGFRDMCPTRVALSDSLASFYRLYVIRTRAALKELIIEELYLCYNELK